MTQSALRNTNKLKLGLFCLNVSGGTSNTTFEDAEKIIPTWEQNTRIAKQVDQAGWEFIIPLGRWRGFGGKTNHNGNQFEVYTWAAGLGAVTNQIQVLATSHVPLTHPIMGAKQGATVDHISSGRFALNIVAGWNEAEMKMFGVKQRPHDERYAAAAEWLTIVRRLWTEDEEVNFSGEYYTIEGGYLQPKPVQAGGPIVVNAGMSPAALDFTAKNCDFSFQSNNDVDALAATNKNLKERAAAHGREIGVLSTGYIVCADTEAEARRYHDYYVDELGDWDGARNMVSQLTGTVLSHTGDEWRAMTRSLLAGWGGIELVGTPEQIAERLVQINSIGCDGIALSWVDYGEGIAQFNEQITPLLVEAGLRGQ